MSIETELMAIKGNKELLLAENVHAWAKRNTRSAIHKALQWDDRKAGYEFRLWQIRRLISIHITYEDGERRIYSLTPDRSRPGGGYRDIDDILRDQALHEILLADALRELERIRSNYDRLKQLRPVWQAIGKVKRSQSRKRKGGDEKRASA